MGQLFKCKQNWRTEHLPLTIKLLTIFFPVGDSCHNRFSSKPLPTKNKYLACRYHQTLNNFISATQTHSTFILLRSSEIVFPLNVVANDFARQTWAHEQNEWREDKKRGNKRKREEKAIGIYWLEMHDTSTWKKNYGVGKIDWKEIKKKGYDIESIL